MIRRIRTHPQLLAFLVAFVFGGGAVYAKTDLELVFSAIGSTFFSITIARPRHAAIIVPAGTICGALVALVTGTEHATLTPARLLLMIGVSVISASGTVFVNPLNNSRDTSEASILCNDP